MNSIGLSPQALFAHRAFIESVARALVHDVHGAEDIAQEVIRPPTEGLPPWTNEPNVDGPSVTAIFQPVARDEFGALTVVWKVLETD